MTRKPIRPIKPLKMKQSGPSPFWRNVISRVTLGVLSATLLYGSYRAVNWWDRAEAEMRAHEAEHNLQGSALETYRRGGTPLPLYFGIGLGVLGVLTFAGAVTAFFERFARPPGDNDLQVGVVRRWLDV